VNCYIYLRTSSADSDVKAGIALQRAACTEYAARAGHTVVAEFVDDDVRGAIHMHARPAGKQLLAALLADGVKVVIAYDSKRLGRTQPVFWRFIEQCADLGVQVTDANGTDLLDSVQGAIGGLMADLDRQQTVARLKAGKLQWKGKRRTDGRHPFGEHPLREYDGERAIVARILSMHIQGQSAYSIRNVLNSEGVTTRYGKVFTTATIMRILKRSVSQ